MTTPIQSGARFGRLTATGSLSRRGVCRTAECRCDCGTVRFYRVHHLLGGRSASCGCTVVMRGDAVRQQFRDEQRDAVSSTRRIPLVTKEGRLSAVAIVDASDYAAMDAMRWHVDSDGYARTAVLVSGRWRSRHMHRFLCQAGAGHVVDHRDGDRLNNTGANLRPATQRQNVQNARANSRSKTGIRGVYPCARPPGFKSNIRLPDGRRLHLGYFPNVEQARAAYAAAAARHHGEFARV